MRDPKDLWFKPNANINSCLGSLYKNHVYSLPEEEARKLADVGRGHIVDEPEWSIEKKRRKAAMEEGTKYPPTYTAKKKAAKKKAAKRDDD